jgi:hypothetical protein
MYDIIKIELRCVQQALQSIRASVHYSPAYHDETEVGR